MHPTKFSTGTLVGSEREPRHHDIIPPVRDGWSQIAMMEWELRGESCTDQHPHDEYNYLLAGRLFVEAGGVSVEQAPGTPFVCRQVRSAAIGHPSTRECWRSTGPIQTGMPASLLVLNAWLAGRNFSRWMRPEGVRQPRFLRLVG